MAVSLLTGMMPVREAAADDRSARAADLARELREALALPIAVFDLDGGALLADDGDVVGPDWDLPVEVLQQVAGRRSVEPIGEEGGLLLVALPRVDRQGRGVVAVAAVATGPCADPAGEAQLVGRRQDDYLAWRQRQSIVPAEVALRLCRLAIERRIADDRAEELRQEVDSLSANIAGTYEEISLVYRVTQHLRVSDNDEELTALTLRWLADTIPAQGFAALMIPVVSARPREHSVRRREPTLLTHGDCPLDLVQMQALVGDLSRELQRQPVVINRRVTDQTTWWLPAVRELVLLPISDGDTVYGYVAAVNHAAEGEFGTVEAHLLAGVASLLAVHAANIDLYRRRAELLTGVVRALTSAIEAKDQYTCGHSDRVARVAVRISQELGCDTVTQNTVYLSGLLHDIGKIGIDDNVLRKPGALTAAEFEHIKLHPELGYKILVDLNELDQVLPIVLHHHENWNGKGYPHGLAGDHIPLLARIMAVADAFDAMGSDRPYRRGMPDDKVDNIIRAGAGSQWDPEVVAAFFRARTDIREIARRDREALSLDARQWMGRK